MNPVEVLPWERQRQQSQSVERYSIGDESTTPIFEALSSATARAILDTLYDRPQTPSEIATAVDSSLPNVNHHLSQLEEEGLIHVADTAYSETNREMNVYAPTSDSLVLRVGGRVDGPETTSDAVLALVAALGVVVGALVTSVLCRLGR